MNLKNEFSGDTYISLSNHSDCFEKAKKPRPPGAVSIYKA
ncbi:hypothetical protein J2T03_003395 [Chryseobacterium lathyri]|nr:hypothetical protein [Chryseobacterium lathyri]